MANLTLKESLQRSLFAVKDYVDTTVPDTINMNINAYYREPVTVADFEFVVDNNFQLTNSSIFDGGVKISNDGTGNGNINAYLNLPYGDQDVTDMGNRENRINVRIYDNDENLVYNKILTASANTNTTAHVTTNSVYKDASGFPTFGVRMWRHATFANCTSTKMIHSFAVQVTYTIKSGYSVWHPMTFRVEITLLRANESAITQFKTLREGWSGKALCTEAINQDIASVAPYSINLGAGESDASPSYSVIAGSNNTFSDTVGDVGACSNLDIRGYSNKLKLIAYASIHGNNNTLTGYYTGAGMKGVSIAGENNTFNEHAGHPDSFLTMHGSHLNATSSGAFFGKYGTVPSTEIFAVCYGTQDTDAPIFSINKTTGAITSTGTPTADNHLVTKKYVDNAIDENGFSGDYNDLSNQPINSLPVHSYSSNNRIIFVEVMNLEKHKWYKLDPQDARESNSSLSLAHFFEDGTSKNFSALTGGYAYSLFFVLAKGTNAITLRQIDIAGGFYERVITIGADSASSTSTLVPLSLSTLNEKEYTPTGNYHPATKKYVDDVVANATPAIITEEDINAIIADIDN